MSISEESTDTAFQVFMLEVEFMINLHVNTCEDDLISKARINMHERLNEYILLYTNLVINDLKEEGVITSN